MKRTTIDGIAVIYQGDSTNSGGTVLEGSAIFSEYGHKLALKGDSVFCPACQSSGIIAEGSQSLVVSGMPVALHGHRVDCGCPPGSVTLVARSVQQVEPISKPLASKAMGEFWRAPPPQPGITLIIGLFFDGSGNNAFNTANNESCNAPEDNTPEGRAAYQALIKHCANGPAATGSYLNDYTNIWKLHQLYEENIRIPDSQVVQRKIYVQGIGTKQGQADDTFSLGTGRGSRGIAAKVEEALSQITKELTDFFKANPQSKVDQLYFDLFGFSRGAAAARHFANLIDTVRGGSNNALYKALAPLFNRQNNAAGDHSLIGKTRFIGLFDTVAAIASPSDLYNPHDNRNRGVDLQLSSDSAQLILHLLAANEYRHNFSLNQALPVAVEIALPGAHSDIGGGYGANDNDEHLYLTRTRQQRVSLDQDKEQSYPFKQSQQDLAKLLSRSDLQLLLQDGEQLAIDCWEKYDNRNKGVADELKYVYAAARIKRRVDHHWSRVPLRIMYCAAEQFNVRFRAIPQDNEHYQLPVELRPIAKKLTTGIIGHLKQQPFPSLTAAELQLILSSYCHLSAHWNPVGNSGSVLHIHRPAADWRRVRHPMRGSLRYD